MFGIEAGMWEVTVLIPDNCLSIYFGCCCVCVCVWMHISDEHTCWFSIVPFTTVSDVLFVKLIQIGRAPENIK